MFIIIHLLATLLGTPITLNAILCNSSAAYNDRILYEKPY